MKIDGCYASESLFGKHLVSSLRRSSFRHVIDLGNEMKWRVLLELTEAIGSMRTHEMVAGSRLIDGTSPETVGLTLAEGKSVLAAMQSQLVQAQADGYCDYRRKCSHCGSRRGIKDWRTRQMTTLFVVVLVETPRFNPCRFGVASRRIVSPLIEIMPDRCTQEYERVLTKMGSLAAYGRAAALMAEFLPSGQSACDRNDAAANPSGGHEIGAAGRAGPKRISSKAL